MGVSHQGEDPAAQTRRDGAPFFGGDPNAVPRHCLTQRLGAILESRRAIVIAMGEAEVAAARQMVEGAISARWPWTALQLHALATVLIDESVAADFELADDHHEASLHQDAVD